MGCRVSRRPPVPDRAVVRRGVYIDFEASVGAAPTLLGILWADGFEQHVLEERFHPAARAWPIGGRGSCLPSTLEAAVSRIAGLAGDGRPVFAYAARFEREHLTAHPGGEALAPDVLDVLPWARAWKRRSGVEFERRPPWEGGRNSLRNMVGLLGLAYPPDLGRHKVGPNLARVRAQLDAKAGRWEEVAPGAKRAWARVLRKNRLDCEFTRTLMEAIAIGDPARPADR
jgi:hypothetical protein